MDTDDASVETQSSFKRKTKTLQSSTDELEEGKNKSNK